jgi:hypothetical protein
MYIASDRNLAYDPRVQRLARALDVSRPTALGHLHYLWYWCQTYAADGNVSADRVNAAELAENALWRGDAQAFLDALVRCGFGERRDDGLWLSGWERLGRKSLKEAARNRKSNAARIERHRERDTT